jgi:hypothetical protein
MARRQADAGLRIVTPVVHDDHGDESTVPPLPP